MLLGRPSFEHVWADAAALRSDVIRVVLVDQPTTAASTATDVSDRTYTIARGPRTRSRVQRRFERRRLAGRLADLAQRLQFEWGPFDLVHGHFSAKGPLVMAMAGRIGVPFVITEHSTAFSGMNPANQLVRSGFSRARRVGAHAAAVLPVTEELQRAMEAHGVRANFVVVPNPVDTTKFVAPDHLPAKATTEIVAVGRLARVKGHDLLLEATAKVRAGHPQARLTIIGEGPERPALEAQARRLGLDDIVTFRGSCTQSQVARCLSEADVFVHPSRWENLSVALLEACVVGLPCIATRVGGTPEIHAEGLRLVPPDDLDALTVALDDVLDHQPDLATRRRWAASAERSFGLEAVGEQIRAVYDDVRRRA